MCAEKALADEIVTWNKDDFDRSAVSVSTPDEILARDDALDELLA